MIKVSLCFIFFLLLSSLVLFHFSLFFVFVDQQSSCLLKQEFLIYLYLLSFKTIHGPTLVTLSLTYTSLTKCLCFKMVTKYQNRPPLSLTSTPPPPSKVPFCFFAFLYSYFQSPPQFKSWVALVLQFHCITMLKNIVFFHAEVSEF